jgi:hypothetical protein
VSQIPFRSNPIPDELLEFLHFGEAFLLRARPDDVFPHPHFKDAARTRLEADFADFILKGSEQFLRSPGSTKEPATLGAIFNLDTGATGDHSIESIW